MLTAANRYAAGVESSPDTPAIARIETALTRGPAQAVALPFPDDCGGEVTFAGRTRGETHPQFGRLLRLEYEAYEPMAAQLLADMAQHAAQRWPCRVIRIVHSIGPVAVGQASVVIQVACPHRAEAFDACRHLIDRLKRELPVWKREIWERGETFVEGCAVRAPG